jgi:(Z)-2-((N-methylformamido)methylene)-5-hydroxybutyrolactone dehydrogenase
MKVARCVRDARARTAILHQNPRMRLALLMSERLRAGTVWVNTCRAVSFMSPFGGYKRSGLGRESGKEAIYEYLQQKSVWISTAIEVPNPFVLR